MSFSPNYFGGLVFSASVLALGSRGLLSVAAGLALLAGTSTATAVALLLRSRRSFFVSGDVILGNLFKRFILLRQPRADLGTMFFGHLDMFRFPVDQKEGGREESG